jgi:hypothetical protein
MVFTEISLLPYTAERFDYLLHNAAEVKSYSCIMQQRVKSSQQGVRFGSGESWLYRPLKEQSCKKIIYGRTSVSNTYGNHL